MMRRAENIIENLYGAGLENSDDAIVRGKKDIKFNSMTPKPRKSINFDKDEFDLQSAPVTPTPTKPNEDSSSFNSKLDCIDVSDTISNLTTPLSRKSCAKSYQNKASPVVNSYNRTMAPKQTSKIKTERSTTYSTYQKLYETQK